MVLIHECIPCQHGDHDDCMGGQAAPEGMLGGWECPCEGECRKRKAPVSPGDSAESWTGDG